LGKIFFVQNGVVKSKDEVLENWSKTDFVKTTQNIESKGWLLDVLKAKHPSITM
jgi:type II restriction enzyme